MKREEAIKVLADMVSPIVGRYLAACVAEKLYETLSGLDKEATDRLLARATAAPLNRP